MPKYTGSWSLYSAVALGVAALAGCAQTPERQQAPPPPPPPAAAAPAPAPVAAEPVPLVRPDVPLRYVVKKGDTLWDISRHFLVEPWQWPEIWYVNGQVRNPHLIYPGDVLTLVWRDGRPMLSQQRVEKLSPQARSLPLEDAIPTIPLDAIRDFLQSPRVVSPEQLKKAPYVLGFIDPHLAEGAGSEVYVKNVPSPEDYRFLSVRLGEQYRDPQTREVLGWEAIPVATMDVRRYGDPSTVYIEKSFRETLVGDRLIDPIDPEYFADFYPHAPKMPVNGQIISVFDGVQQIGQYQVITLNRGAREGIERGHVLSIYATGRDVVDPDTHRHVQLPDVLAGTAMVFKVEDKVSYALVMDATRAVHVLDYVRQPGNG